MTKHQKEKFDEILNSPDKTVALWGEGGTGKSHSISRFIGELSIDDHVCLCTTTHQSLAVLREMLPSRHDCGIKIDTIHKHLGFRVAYNKQNKELIKSNKVPDSCDYLIIDESSYLTRQLLDYIYSRECQRSVHKKIILVGDKMQLKLDDLLDLESVPSVELTVNMRQTVGSELHAYCRALRHQIEIKGSPIAIPETDDMEVIYNHTDFVKKYKDSNEEKSIIAFLNSTVKTYNSNIKKKMLGASVLSVGDELVVIDPVMSMTTLGMRIMFNNRAKVRITEVVDNSDSNYWRKAQVDKYDFDYLEVLKDNITLIGVTNGIVNAYIKVPNTKTWVKSVTDSLAVTAKNTGNWKPMYEFKESFNMVHHSYAMTVFSAQGSTYDEVYIDLSDFNPPKDPTKEKLMRMVYVAMTRARKKAIVYLGTRARDYDKFGRE